MFKNNGSVKKVLIAVLVSILIPVIIASSFFAILDALVNIIEEFIAKLVNVVGNILQHPGTYLQDFFSTIFEGIDLLIQGGDQTFDPNTLSVQRLQRPAVVVGQGDFDAIKANIDMAKVNRDTAGLEDYMLKVMLLSYYRSVYLSDFDILMEITIDDSDPENLSEKTMIETMNTEAASDPNKYRLSFYYS